MPRARGTTSFAYAWPSFFSRSRSCPALTASSNAACTFSGGCTFCSVTFCTKMPVP